MGGNWWVFYLFQATNGVHFWLKWPCVTWSPTKLRRKVVFRPPHPLQRFFPPPPLPGLLSPPPHPRYARKLENRNVFRPESGISGRDGDWTVPSPFRPCKSLRRPWRAETLWYNLVGNFIPYNLHSLHFFRSSFDNGATPSQSGVIWQKQFGASRHRFCPVNPWGGLWGQKRSDAIL